VGTSPLYARLSAGVADDPNLFAAAGTGRDLHWLSGEASVETHDREIRLRWATAAEGRLIPERLLASEYHGRWIRWVDGQRAIN